MKYLVFPKDALKPQGYIRTSEHFPTIVETSERFPFTYFNGEDILRKVFKLEPFEPRDGKQYCIVPVSDSSQIVTFHKMRPIPRPKEFYTTLEPF